MGNHPVDGRLRQPGDIDELPHALVADLVKDGLLDQMPDGTEPSEVLRPERSLLVGINITEAELAEKFAVDTAASGISAARVRRK
jgi:hypothetical protein